MIAEHVDRRVLCALSFRDSVTGLPVDAVLRVAGTGIKVVRNLSGLYVLLEAPRFDEYARSFPSAPAQPGAGSETVELAVIDDSQRYLSRRVALSLPLDGDARFQAVQVLLFPSPAAPTAANWGVLRAVVRRAGAQDVLAGALIRALGPADAVLGRALSDSRGEALIAIQGIPVISFSEGGDDVLTNGQDVTLETIFNPDAQGLPDPDALEQNRADLPTGRVTLRMESGREQTAELTVALP